jgi:hypothetical protein
MWAARNNIPEVITTLLNLGADAKIKDVKDEMASRHLIGCAADIARPSNVDYDVLVSMARRLAGEGNGWEIVTYPSRTYFHFGVPRAHEGELWDGNKFLSL